HVGSAQAILQHVLPFMTAEGWGRWVNVLSTSVYEPIDNLGVSNLTRAAMASWAKTLSRELPPGVTINNVLPGFTDTERLTALAAGRAEKSGQTEEAVRESWIAQVPEGRLADPTETAAMIAFLASPDGAYVRGQSIAVDGGRLRGI
ncbi:MAG: SDR family oxidoreductase, partial [Myxococcales bacterium]|nr:SDR family oxidoreductase [Myxococcales bacterium]